MQQNPLDDWGEVEPAIDAIVAMQGDLEQRMDAIVPQTMEGVRAVALAILAWAERTGSNRIPCEADDHWRLVCLAEIICHGQPSCRSWDEHRYGTRYRVSAADQVQRLVQGVVELARELESPLRSE